MFWPVRGFDFVNYDDFEFIVDNPHIQGGLTLDNIGWAFANAYRSTGGPITWLSHMTDVSMFGMHAGPQHVVNVVVHLLATLAVFWSLSRLTRDVMRSAAVAALFAMHPVHVESVAWISERKDVLSGLMFFACVWLYARYAEAPSRSRYVSLAVAFVIALMCKPMAMTLPFVLLLVDVWPLQRARPFGVLIVEKLPLLALSVLSAALVLFSQQGIGAVASFDQVPFAGRVANAIVSSVAYLAKAIWPTALSPFYPYRTSIPIWQVMAAGTAMIAISYAAIALRRRAPYVFVGWFWYLVTIAPVIGLVQVGGHAMADRFTYIPFVGLFIMAVWTMPARRITMAAAIALIIAAAAGARAQTMHWRSSLALWQHAVEVDSFNARAHANLGVAFAKTGDRVHAIDEYRRAIDLQSNDPYAHNNLGLALAEQGSLADAIEQYRSALAAWPAYANAHNNLANALADSGHFTEALAHHAEAIRLDPSNELYRYNNSVTLKQMMAR